MLNKNKRVMSTSSTVQEELGFGCGTASGAPLSNDSDKFRDRDDVAENFNANNGCGYYVCDKLRLSSESKHFSYTPSIVV